jgi:hypothetical protein
MNATKKKNGTLDQSSGSIIREKMNATKKKNGTLDQSSGSIIREKMNATKKKNGTMISGSFAWTSEQRKKFNNDYKPGFLSWTKEQRTEHNRENAEKLRKGEKTYNRLIELTLLGEYEKYKQRKLFIRYVKKVNFFTKKQPLHLLLNIEKRGKGQYHLDHKFSKLQGFLNNIDPVIIGNIINLEMITEVENSSKQDKCSITKENLLSLYHKNC